MCSPLQLTLPEPGLTVLSSLPWVMQWIVPQELLVLASILRSAVYGWRGGRYAGSPIPPGGSQSTPSSNPFWELLPHLLFADWKAMGSAFCKSLIFLWSRRKQGNERYNRKVRLRACHLLGYWSNDRDHHHLRLAWVHCVDLVGKEHMY